MASSPPSLCSYRSLSCNNDKLLVKYPQIRSQSFSDEGKSTNIVDANMKVLKERMEQVRKKERSKHGYGWNYQSGYVPKDKREAMLLGEVIGAASGALGFALLSGFLCIYLISLLLHFTAS